MSQATLAAAPIDLERILSMTRPELDELYRGGTLTPPPRGNTRGTAILHAGSWAVRPLALLVRCIAWRGKVFNAAGDGLVNKIILPPIKAIRAKVYEGESWLDGGRSIIIDYAETSRVARKVRDEVRRVAPGIYLGKVYWGDRSKRLVDFVLTCDP